MHTSSTVFLCYGAIPELDEASVRQARDPPPQREGDWAEVASLLAQDRDRIAADIAPTSWCAGCSPRGSLSKRHWA